MDIAKSALPRQVAGYEPHVALFGGKDGLRDIKGVIEAAHAARANEGPRRCSGRGPPHGPGPG